MTISPKLIDVLAHKHGLTLHKKDDHHGIVYKGLTVQSQDHKISVSYWDKGVEAHSGYFDPTIQLFNDLDKLITAIK